MNTIEDTNEITVTIEANEIIKDLLAPNIEGGIIEHMNHVFIVLEKYNLLTIQGKAISHRFLCPFDYE